MSENEQSAPAEEASTEESKPKKTQDVTVTLPESTYNKLKGIAAEDMDEGKEPSVSDISKIAKKAITTGLNATTPLQLGKQSGDRKKICHTTILTVYLDSSKSSNSQSPAVVAGFFLEIFLILMWTNDIIG